MTPEEDPPPLLEPPELLPPEEEPDPPPEELPEPDDEPPPLELPEPLPLEDEPEPPPEELPEPDDELPEPLPPEPDPPPEEAEVPELPPQAETTIAPSRMRVINRTRVNRGSRCGAGIPSVSTTGEDQVLLQLTIMSKLPGVMDGSSVCDPTRKNAMDVLLAWLRLAACGSNVHRSAARVLTQDSTISDLSDWFYETVG